MKIKNFFYEEADGIHFPDAFAGSEEVYQIDFSRFLKEEGAYLDDTLWEVDAGLKLMKNYICPDAAHTACVEIGTPFPGSFNLRCLARIVKGSQHERIVVPMVIRVY